MMLAALSRLADEVPCLWGVFGYGSDAELTPAEIDRALSVVAEHGGLLGAWGLTPAVVAELRRVIAHVPTEASAIAVACAEGARGTLPIRQGTRSVAVSPVGAVTFYLAPRVLYEQVAALARLVADAPSLTAASALLVEHGPPRRPRVPAGRPRHLPAPPLTTGALGANTDFRPVPAFRGTRHDRSSREAHTPRG
jgi:hypothetical protein